MGIRNFLDLFGWCVERVDGYDTICLVWKETGCVTDINYGTSTEDLRSFCCKDGNLLVLPVVQIL